MAARMKILASVQDWFFDAISLGHDQTIRLVLELDGTLDGPRLRRALRHVLEAEPVLRCRYQSGIFRAYWRPREDADRLEVAPELELCRLVPTDDARRDVHAFMAAGVDPRVDPLVQMGIFRAATDTVCVKVSHVAMDGAGMKKLVERLTTNYRALAVDPSSVLPADLALDRGQGQVLKAFPLRERLRAFFTQPFHEKRWHFPFLEGKPSELTFSERAPAVRVPELRRRAKARGATITDVLLTGFVQSVFEMTETPLDVPLPFTVAVDLRRFHDDPDSLGMCNLSSLAWIEVQRRKGAGFTDILSDVHAAFAATMANAPGVGLAMVMEIASVLGCAAFVAGNRLRIRMARREGREFPSLSNMGVFDATVADFGHLRVTKGRFWGPVIFPPSFFIIAGSFEDELYFTASYPRNLVPADLIERMLDRIVAEIDSLD
jgi:NRPS condensation-like uncharacterized protein